MTKLSALPRQSGLIATVLLCVACTGETQRITGEDVSRPAMTSPSLNLGSASTIQAEDPRTGSVVAFDPERNKAIFATTGPSGSFEVDLTPENQALLINYIRETNDRNFIEMELANKSLVPECSGSNWTGCQQRGAAPVTASNLNLSLGRRTPRCAGDCPVLVRVKAQSANSASAVSADPFTPGTVSTPIAGIGNGIQLDSFDEPDCTSIGNGIAAQRWAMTEAQIHNSGMLSELTKELNPFDETTGAPKISLPDPLEIANKMSQMIAAKRADNIQMSLKMILWNRYQCGGELRPPNHLLPRIGGGGGFTSPFTVSMCGEVMYEISFDGGRTWFPVVKYMCLQEVMR